MFCSNCGNEMDDEAIVCVSCGRSTKSMKRTEKWTTGAMSCFIVATVIIPIVGLVAGVCSLFYPEKREQGGILLIVGIVMTAIHAMALSV